MIQTLAYKLSVRKKVRFMILYTLAIMAALPDATCQRDSLASHLMSMAEGHRKNAQPDSAVVYYEKAALEFMALNKLENVADAYNQAGTILTRQDRYESAKHYLDKALSAGMSLPDTNNLAVATTYITLGVVYNAEEEYTTSLICHQKALSIRILKLGEYHADVATSYGNIGNVYLNSGDDDKAIEAHLKAMEIREHVFGPTGNEVTQTYYHLGRAYRANKEYSISLVYFEKALQNKIEKHGPGHKDLVALYDSISDVYFLMGNTAQGEYYNTLSAEILNR